MEVTWWRASARERHALAAHLVSAVVSFVALVVSAHDHHTRHPLPLIPGHDMSQLPQLLLASLDPNSRKQAEQSLHALSQQHGFLPTLLTLVLDPSQDRAVRLAGSVFFKNVVKNKWADVRLTC